MQVLKSDTRGEERTQGRAVRALVERIWAEVGADKDCTVSLRTPQQAQGAEQFVAKRDIEMGVGT